jgi:hypothetical protein
MVSGGNGEGLALQHLEHAIDVGRKTRIAATKVRNSLFPRWRQRAFRRHLGRFIVALQQVPQTEAAQLTAADLAELNQLNDSLVAEAERFIAERHESTTAQVEQDRFVVTEIYQLRAIVEMLARHVTADPAVMDVGWTVRTETANRRKP